MKGKGGRTASALPHDTSPRRAALPGAPLCSAAGCPGEVQSPGAVAGFPGNFGGGRLGSAALRSARPAPAALRRPVPAEGEAAVCLAGSLFLLHGGYLNVLLSITRHFLTPPPAPRSARRRRGSPHNGGGNSEPRSPSPAEPLEPRAPNLLLCLTARESPPPPPPPPPPPRSREAAAGPFIIHTLASHNTRRVGGGRSGPGLETSPRREERGHPPPPPAPGPPHGSAARPNQNARRPRSPSPGPAGGRDPRQPAPCPLRTSPPRDRPVPGETPRGSGARRGGGAWGWTRRLPKAGST